MTRKAALLVGCAFIIASSALSLWAYPHLSARVPTHWDLAGQVNGSSSRLAAVIFPPAILVMTLLLMIALPLVSPRNFRIDGFAGSYYAIFVATVAVLTYLQVVVLRAQLGGSAPADATVDAAIGALLAVVGNFMGKTRKNFFVGVRTPWTLASDEVWLRTNRLAGMLMVIGGLALLTTSVVPSLATTVLLAVSAAVVVVPVAYSYVLYQRIVGFGGGGPAER